ncbi:MAG: dihydrofolate reductase [Halioglobus sp.]|jgi:dihydrofolate reductase
MPTFPRRLQCDAHTILPLSKQVYFVPMKLSVIVAVAENGVVGKNNALPWQIPADLQYFKRTTLGKPIVMGRKTFESIGRPLPGRTNIVISSNPAYAAEGVSVVSSLSDALALARKVALIDGSDELMVIGGAAIYESAVPLADRLYVTEIHASVAGDAYLSPLDWDNWVECSREWHAAIEPNTYDFSFVVYDRTNGLP